MICPYAVIASLCDGVVDGFWVVKMDGSIDNRTGSKRVCVRLEDELSELSLVA